MMDYNEVKELTLPPPLLNLGSEVDTAASTEAHREMNQLMQRVASAYSEKWELHSRYDDRSTITEYHIQEGIGQLGLLHPLISFMNIACIGHPFLQYDAFVDRTFLKKYGIEMGQSYVRKRNSALLVDFMKFVREPVKCGGDALKTAEAAQWVLFYPKSVAFLGSLGGDAESEDIIDCIQEMNLAYKLENKIKDRSTIQLIIRFGTRWSEVYIFDRGAPSLSLRFIDRPRVSSLLERAQLIFICGRSCLTMKMGLSRLAYFTSSRFKTLCLQLCEGISLSGMEKAFTEVIKYMDLFFLSKKTALMLIKVFNIYVPGMWYCYTPTRLVILSIGRWVKSLSKKPCTVIIYEGIKVAHVATDTKMGNIRKYRSKFYQPNNIVDLYGCESAFSGGYLAQMVQRCEMRPCLDCAFFCASAVATQMGAHFPINRLELLMQWRDQEEQGGQDLQQRPLSVFSSGVNNTSRRSFMNTSGVNNIIRESMAKVF